MRSENSMSVPSRTRPDRCSTASAWTTNLPAAESADATPGGATRIASVRTSSARNSSGSNRMLATNHPFCAAEPCRTTRSSRPPTDRATSRPAIHSRMATALESEPPIDAMTSPLGDHTAGSARTESMPRFNSSVDGVHTSTLRTGSAPSSSAAGVNAVACRSLSTTTSWAGDGSSAIAWDTARTACDRSSRTSHGERVSNTARASRSETRRGRPSARTSQSRSSSPTRSNTSRA